VKSLRALLPAAAAALVVFTARASFADHYRVPSESMQPTVHVGDHILVSKMAYGIRIPMTRTWLASFGLPSRGDVVVLEPPEPPEEGTSLPTANGELPAVLLKRIVALPGERVEVRQGHVIIDGTMIDEPWASFRSGTGPPLAPTRVPPGKVLVLGDNRGNSRDGRVFGFVAVEDVIGRATAVVMRDAKPTHQPL
jgi:signal peptidase I